MPNFKKEFQKWLESNEKGRDSLARIIAMMHQSGVDDVNNLPDVDCDINPDLLVAEHYKNSPLPGLVNNPSKEEINGITTPEDINNFFRKFQSDKMFQDPDFVQEQDARRLLHANGLLTNAEILSANPNNKQINGVTVQLSKEERETIKKTLENYDTLEQVLGNASVQGLDEQTTTELEDYRTLLKDIRNTSEEYRELKTDKQLLEAYSKLGGLKNLLNKEIEPPKGFEDYGMFKDGMTVYDLMDCTSRNLKNQPLSSVLQNAGIPLPEAAEKANQRQQELLDREPQAEAAMKENGLPLASDAEKSERMLKNLNAIWYTLNTVDAMKHLPEEMQKEIKEIHRKATNLFNHKDPLLRTNANLLDLCQKTAQALPKILETDVELTGNKKEVFGDKMPLMAYLTAEQEGVGWNIERFNQAVQDMGELGLKLDTSKVQEQSKQFLAEAKRRREEERLRRAEEYRRAEEEKRRIENDPAEQTIRTNVQLKTNFTEKRKHDLMERFGPKAELHERNGSRYKPESMKAYNAIELPVPDGLTPEFVAMIALGDAMDQSKLDKKMTSSNPGFGQSLAEFNAEYIIMNIIGGDNRSIEYSDHLVESRQHTKKILEDYQNGNPEGVQKALQNVVPSALRAFQFMGNEPKKVEAPEKELPLIVKKMAEYDEKQRKLAVEKLNQAEELKQAGKLDEAKKLEEEARKIPRLGVHIPMEIEPKVNSHIVRMEASDQAVENYKQMFKDRPAPNSPERQKLVAEFLFNQAVQVETYSSDIYGGRQYNDVEIKISDRLRSDLGMKPGDPNDPYRRNDFARMVSDYLEEHDKEMPGVKDFVDLIDRGYGPDVERALKAAYMTPGELMLSKEGGKEKLRELYMEDIKKSEIYKKMVSEPDMAKLSTMMKEHSSDVNVSFGAYSDKKVPVENPAELTIKSQEAVYQKKLKELNKQYDILASSCIIESECEDALDELNTLSALHKDSKELKNLKEKTKALQQLQSFDNLTLQKELTPEVKKALKEAYEASVAYERAKRKDAKVPDDNKTWEPSSIGGKARMRGAKKIQELATRFIGDELAKERSLEANTALNAYQTTAQNEKAFNPVSVVGGIMLEQQENLKKSVSDVQEKQPDAKAEAVSENLAKIIATRKVGEAMKGMTYDDLLDTLPAASSKIKPDKAKKVLNDMITEASALIQERPDFQKMVQGMSLEEAKELALSPDGGKLVAKLAQAKKQLLAEEKQQQAPGKQAGKQMDKKNFSM